MRRLAFIALALALAACDPAQPPLSPPNTEVARGEARMDTPQPGARVTSPLVVTGAAPGSWYFEAVFPAQLLDANGALIAEAPAQAQGDWMTQAPVPFRAELNFTVETDTPAILLLQEDMQEDGAARELRVPVVLAGR